jgi:anaerobic selenocysteine-containing dehydrogenase
VVAPVEVTDELMPGVVSLPHGWGHDKEGTRLSVAKQRPGVNMNALVDHAALDVPSGSSVMNGVPVTIERVTGG